MVNILFLLNPAPLIFIHYGQAGYLPVVLSAARRSNPGKEIYFLGDDSNRRLVPNGVRFFPLQAFRRGDLLAEFQKVFVPLAGRAHHFNKTGGVETWLRFVFERWFVIREFLHAQSIGAFWIFDSDTLIAGDLASREERFVGFDATEQCAGCCLNGYVSSREVVDGYCQKMVELFRRPGYLDAQRRRLEEHAGLAFNEMDAWQTHRAEEGFKTLPLGTPRDGEAFDDALAITGGWQMATTKVRNRIPVKRLVRDERGGFFGFPADTPDPVRLVTLNLSWLPDYVFHRLASGCLPTKPRPYDSKFCREVDFSEPLRDRLMRHGQEWLWNLRTRRSGSTSKAFLTADETDGTDGKRRRSS